MTNFVVWTVFGNDGSVQMGWSTFVTFIDPINLPSKRDLRHFETRAKCLRHRHRTSIASVLLENSHSSPRNIICKRRCAGQRRCGKKKKDWPLEMSTCADGPRYFRWFALQIGINIQYFRKPSISPVYSRGPRTMWLTSDTLYIYSGKCNSNVS